MLGCSTKRELRLFNDLDQNQTETNKTRILSSKKVLAKYSSYIIRPHDRLQVNVYGYQELNTPKSGILIDSSGRAILPLVGRVRVSGMTEASASQKIQRLMRGQISDIIVSVEVPNKVVYVIGDVTKPGSIKLSSGKIVLLRAIASAGGFKDTANKDTIYLVRQSKGKAKLIRLSMSSSDSLANAFKMLLPGDIVYVSPNSTKLINMGSMQTLKIIGSALSPFAAVNSLVN